MRKLKSFGFIVVCLLISAVFFTACSSTPEEPEGRAVVEVTIAPTEAPTEEPTVEPTPEPTDEFLYRELGDKVPGASSFLLTNNTDFMFTSLELGTPNDESNEATSDSIQYGSNIVPSDAPIQQGDTVCIYYSPWNLNQSLQRKKTTVTKCLSSLMMASIILNSSPTLVKSSPCMMLLRRLSIKSTCATMRKGKFCTLNTLMLSPAMR